MLAAIARPSDRARLILLVLIAAVSAAVYAALTVSMSLDEFFPGPGVTLDFQFMLGDDWEANAWRLYGSFAALFALWGLALWLVARLAVSRWSVAVAVLGAIAMAAALVPMYPPFAVDLFHYLGEGRLLWVEGENPMVRGPGQFLPIGISFGTEPAAYGPLWYWTLGPPVLAGGDDFPRSLLLLKGWMVGWLALTALLGALISRRVQPGRELLVAVAIAWNPYVLWRVAGNGHNDITMMAFALLAIWLAVCPAAQRRSAAGPSQPGSAEGRWRWVLPALAASVLVKYISLLLLPALLVFLWRRPSEERRALLPDLAIGAAFAAVVVIAAFAPMWEGFAVFDQVRAQGGRLISSTPELISTLLSDAFDVSPRRADQLGVRIGAAAFGAVAAFLLWRQRPGHEALIAVSASLMLAYALIGVGWFRPWYFLWVVTLTALLPGRWSLALGVAASVAGLTPDVAEKYAVFVEALRPLTRAHPSLPAILAQFLPPALVWLAALLSTRSSSLDAAQLTTSTGTSSRPARSAS